MVWVPCIFGVAYLLMAVARWLKTVMERFFPGAIEEDSTAIVGKKDSVGSGATSLDPKEDSSSASASGHCVGGIWRPPQWLQAPQEKNKNNNSDNEVTRGTTATTSAPIKISLAALGDEEAGHVLVKKIQ